MVIGEACAVGGVVKPEIRCWVESSRCRSASIELGVLECEVSSLF